MIIRVPLTKNNCSSHPIYLPSSGNDTASDHNSDNNSGNNSGGNSDDGASGNNPDSFSLPSPRFVLSPLIPDPYANARYAHPVAPVNVTIPSADLDIVKNWLGISSSNASVPSDTLRKRMTTAVMGALSAYFREMSRRGLFTSPFRIGCALRLADGTHLYHSPSTLLKPNNRAPLLLIRDYTLTDTSIATVSEIINTPYRLSLSLPAFTLPEELTGEVTALDIYATHQADLFDGSEAVSGIRTFSYAGENSPGWLYNRLDENSVIEAAESDSSFRIIASVPIADAVAGIDTLTLPTIHTDLEDWSAYEMLGADDSPEAEELPYDEILIRSEPLDLGMPETRKRVTALTVRGIFSDESRKTGGIVTRLYGAHHRMNAEWRQRDWQLVAQAAGLHVRLLRGVAYRWWRVEIRAPKDSVADALTFSAHPAKFEGTRL